MEIRYLSIYYLDKNKNIITYTCLDTDIRYINRYLFRLKLNNNTFIWMNIKIIFLKIYFKTT